MDASARSGTARRANELYWESDESVNRIADALDLSKSALYGLVEPYPAGVDCPRCAVPAHFANRTARQRALASCPSCDWQGTVSTPDAAPPEERAAAPPAPRTSAALNRVLIGSALLGAAAGIALVAGMRRGR